MGNFSSISSKLEKCIFTEEFAPIYRKSNRKMIFITYGMLGAFCFDNCTKITFRKFWIAYNIFNFLVVNSCCIFYYVNLPTYDIKVIAQPVLAMLPVFWVVISTTLSFLYRNRLTKIIDTLSDESDKGCDLVQETLVPTHAEYYLKPKGMAKKLTYILCVWIAAIASFVPRVLTIENQELRKNFFLHYYPIYYPFEKTPILNLAIQFLQTLTILPGLLAAILNPVFQYILAEHTYSKFVHLKENLEEFSRSAFQSIEKTYELETEMDEKKYLRKVKEKKFKELKANRMKITQEFISRLVKCIKRHQQLILYVKSFIPFVECILSLGYVSAIGAIILTGVFLTSSDLTEDTQFITNSAPIFFIITSFCIFLWLLYCYVGTLFQDMNDLIAEQIYACPWYRLSPKDRKLVLTFLTISQRPIRIKILGVYSLNLAFFPISLKKAYSDIEVLRTVQNKIKQQRSE